MRSLFLVDVILPNASDWAGTPAPVTANWSGDEEESPRNAPTTARPGLLTKEAPFQCSSGVVTLTLK